MCAQSVQTTASAGPSSAGQGEHVGAGAVERQQRRDVAEQLAERALALRGPAVVAVGEGVAVVGPGDASSTAGWAPAALSLANERPGGGAAAARHHR